MELWPPHVYLAEARKQGIPSDTATAALEEAHRLQQRNLPAILSLQHLAWHTDVSYTFLHEIVSRERDPYRVFQIRKRSNGHRNICVPAPPLARVQKWLNAHVLSQVPPHSASQAYSPGASIKHCASRHLGCRWLIKVDIRQFFES